jgi:ketosteroid isomerase-like protein
MSTDVFHEMNSAVGRRDVQALVDRCHSDAVWEHNPGGGSPEEGTYHGREQIAQLFERILEGWEYMRMEVAELSETDAGVYEVRGQMRCKHSTTDMEILERYEQHVEFRDGLMARCRMVFGS